MFQVMWRGAGVCVGGSQMLSLLQKMSCSLACLTYSMKLVWTVLLFVLFTLYYCIL